ncbi:MAG: type II toxin-antitoxin system VapC family toxin [Deltaproteobacteria bacterium]|nr:type II toxin-antitoxin system VapC family toxin [Deltaproteobacteria bacterium]
MGFLIDTCIWIDVERGTLSGVDVAGYTGDEAVFISPVTLAELTFGAEMARDEKIRQRRIAALSRLRKKPFVIIDEITGEVFGRLAAGLRQKGLEHKYRVQDLWLASQAIQNGFTLLTRNEKDFSDIPGLELMILAYGKN